MVVVAVAGTDAAIGVGAVTAIGAELVSSSFIGTVGVVGVETFGFVVDGFLFS